MPHYRNVVHSDDSVAASSGALQLPRGAEPIFRRLQGAGYECYLVGGSVRDLLLERAGADLDFTTNARPPELLRLFRGSHYENRFGTVLVRAGRAHHEVTTYRGEGRYSDHRHPDEIRFVDRLEDDLRRRDFTINAMAMDSAGAIVDPHGGRDDLDRRLIRAVGDPAERLAEDPLRMMRAVRLATQLGFTIEERTQTAILTHAGLLAIISRERVRDELLKILAAEHPDAGIELLSRLRLLDDALPGLAACRSGTQAGGAYQHALATLRNCGGSATLRLAALLHVLTEHPSPPAPLPQGERGAKEPRTGAAGLPIPPSPFAAFGEPSRPAREGGDASYHADIEDRTFPSPHRGGVRGEVTPLDVELARLRMSNAETAQVRRLAEAVATLPEDLPADDRTARRLLSAYGDLLPDLLLLLEAHQRALIAQGGPAAGTGQKANLRALDRLRRLVERVQREQQPVSLAQLALRGDDLVRELNIKPGPRVGQLLEQLLERVLDDPSLNERATLLSIARAL